MLSWPVAYRDKILRYAEMLQLPLLVAWRRGTFWRLIDVRQLTQSPVRYKIPFHQAMKQTLMTELAGDFSFSLRPDCGMHFKIQKLNQTENGFKGVVEDAFWMNADRERFNQVPGVFPLFLCLEQESVVIEEGEYVTQSFVIPDAPMSEFAS